MMFPFPDVSGSGLLIAAAPLPEDRGRDEVAGAGVNQNLRTAADAALHLEPTGMRDSLHVFH